MLTIARVVIVIALGVGTELGNLKESILLDVHPRLASLNFYLSPRKLTLSSSASIVLFPRLRREDFL